MAWAGRYDGNFPPRAHEPWTPAEDRRLLRLIRSGDETDWFKIATVLGRTVGALQTRHQIVKNAIRWCRMQRKKGRGR